MLAPELWLNSRDQRIYRDNLRTSEGRSVSGVRCELQVSRACSRDTGAILRTNRPGLPSKLHSNRVRGRQVINCECTTCVAIHDRAASVKRWCVAPNRIAHSSTRKEIWQLRDSNERHRQATHCNLWGQRYLSTGVGPFPFA